MEFGILGPLHAGPGAGGSAFVLSQPRQQQVLAALLLRANRVCPPGLLGEAINGPADPAGAARRVHVAVTRLRAVLGPAASRLVTAGAAGCPPQARGRRGYLMIVHPGELDSENFTSEADAGRAALEQGDAPGAVAALTAAMARWGNPPLPAVPDIPALRSDRDRLLSRRRAAEGDLVSAQLAAGAPREAALVLRSILADTPDDEHAARQLMLACLQLGSREQALDAFAACRRALRERQGCDPGPELTGLQRQILTGAAVPGEPAQATALRPGRPLALRSQAPPPPGDFTGRAAELAAVTGGCQAGPGVPVTVICGGPGTGKSALAAAAALALRAQFADGQLYAELGGARDARDVLADLLASLGVPASQLPPPGQARTAMYRNLLAGRKVLVIADGAASAGQVRTLLPAAGGAAVLVTSRSRLASLGAAATVELGDLPDGDAAALLAAAAGPGRLAADSPEARAIAAGCGQLPLALRLAGALLARQPGLPPGQLAAWLAGGRALELLRADGTSVAGALDSAFGAAGERARAALGTAAALMPGDIPGWALDEIAGGDPQAAAELADAGLISPAGDAGPRYRVHPLTRAFALQQLTAAPGQTVVRRLGAGWLRRALLAARQLPAVPFAPLAAPGSPVPRQAGELAEAEPGAAWLDTERANLAAAAEQAASAGRHQDAVALASCVTASLHLRGRYGEAARLWRTVAAGAGEVAAATARYYQAAAQLSAGAADGTEISAELAGSLVVLEQAGAAQTAALGWCLLAERESRHHDHAAAVAMARRALARAPAGLARCAALTTLGLSLARSGTTEGETAARHCEQARAAASSSREPAYEAHAVAALAQIMLLRGDPGGADALCRDGIALARSYGGVIDAARFELLRGTASQRSGRPEAAIAPLTAAAECFSAAGLIAAEIDARRMLAASYSSAGQHAAADGQRELLSRLDPRPGSRPARATWSAVRDPGGADELRQLVTRELLTGA